VLLFARAEGRANKTMRGFRCFKALVLALSGLVTAIACSGDSKEDKPGQLMVALQSDMSFPKDVSKIRIQVLVRGQVRHDQTYLVAPDGTTKIPATLAVVAGEEKAPPVEVRVIGIRKTEARTFSKVVTTVPVSRIATLRIPIQWLCEGTAREISQETYDTTCEPAAGEETSCVAGTCQKVNIPEADLPNFDPIDVFGGGQQENDPSGVCFDTQRCFTPGFDVQPTDDCKITIPVPVGRQANFAVKTGPNGDGICNLGNQECYVPLDNSRNFGWYELSGSGGASTQPIGSGGATGSTGMGGASNGDGGRSDGIAGAPSSSGGNAPVEPIPDAGTDIPPPDSGPAAETEAGPPAPAAPLPADAPALPAFPDYRTQQEGGGPQKTFQLPPAVCSKLKQKRAIGIRASLACQSKTERYPTCGPWSPISTSITPNSGGGSDGGIVNPDCPEFVPGQDFGAKFGKHAIDTFMSAASQLSPKVDEMRQNAYDTCRRMSDALGGTSTPAVSPLTDIQVTEMCNAAANLLRGGPQEPGASVLVSSGVCVADSTAQIQCEAKCASGPCEPTTLASRCTGQIGGSCDGLCTGQCMPKNVDATVQCSSSCMGVCQGTCEGVCVTRNGEPASDGNCNGWCQGVCNGACEGTCMLSGSEEVSPNCTADCWGHSEGQLACSGNLTNPTCSQPLDATTCVTDALCSDACAAQAAVGQQCKLTRTTVYGTAPQTLRDAVDMNLGPMYDMGLRSSNLMAAATRMAQTPHDTSLATKELACISAAKGVTYTAITSLSNVIQALNQIYQATTTRFGQGGVPNLCGANASDPVCDACAKSACCSEYSACAQDSVCMAESICMRPCLATEAPAICEQRCGGIQSGTESKQLTDKGRALQNCLEGSCYTQCHCPQTAVTEGQSCTHVGLACNGCSCNFFTSTASSQWQCNAGGCPPTTPSPGSACSDVEENKVCDICTCVSNVWQCGT
jgi:hypothetical protein